MRVSRWGTTLTVLLGLFCVSLTPVAVPGAQETKALLLFGGSDHKMFLGCLNCVDTSSVSVCNDVGEYGSDVAENSIWNDVGTFGSDVSPFSPWDDVSTDAPIIVDRDGKSYGYFSTNTVHHDRTRIGWLVAVLDYYEDTNDLDKTRERMCDD
ncbi:MAG TPA: hypothetical protein VMM16_13285 [Verrucomicrobiae bacterium]|nr:hypothetical protein [Verrucomicrobiae bacterium]